MQCHSCISDFYRKPKCLKVGQKNSSATSCTSVVKVCVALSCRVKSSITALWRLPVDFRLMMSVELFSVCAISLVLVLSISLSAAPWGLAVFIDWLIGLFMFKHFLFIFFSHTHAARREITVHEEGKFNVHPCTGWEMSKSMLFHSLQSFTPHLLHRFHSIT